VCAYVCDAPTASAFPASVVAGSPAAVAPLNLSWNATLSVSTVIAPFVVQNHPLSLYAVPSETWISIPERTSVPAKSVGRESVAVPAPPEPEPFAPKIHMPFCFGSACAVSSARSPSRNVRSVAAIVTFVSVTGPAITPRTTRSTPPLCAGMSAGTSGCAIPPTEKSTSTPSVASIPRTIPATGRVPFDEDFVTVWSSSR
jgi:hypothetical protein